MKPKLDEQSHWNFAEEFTGREAAQLIAGCDPSFSDTNIDSKTQPIIKRLKRSYYDATRSFTLIAQSFFSISSSNGANFSCRLSSINHLKPEATQIWSLEMENLMEDYIHIYEKIDYKKNIRRSDGSVEQAKVVNNLHSTKYTSEIEVAKRITQPINKWIEDYIHEFDDQKFSRTQLSRWINENNFPSHYNFSTTAQSEKVLRSNERDTLLIMIGALCKKLDIKYDPLDHNTVSTIMNLVQKLGVSLSDPTIRAKLHKISAAVDHNKTVPYSTK